MAILLKIVLINALIFHGLLHLLGSSKELDYIFRSKDYKRSKINYPLLMHQIGHLILSLLWTFVFVIFIYSITGIITGHIWWKSLIALGVFISSLTIATSWNESRFGLIPNILILFLGYIIV